MTAHIIRPCIVASHAKTKQGLSGATRLNPYDEQTTASQRLACDKKAPDCVKRSKAINTYSIETSTISLLRFNIFIISPFLLPGGNCNRHGNSVLSTSPSIRI